MNKTEAIKHILIDQRLTQTAVAKRMGVATNTLVMRIQRDNIGVSALTEILKALDYKLVIMPANVKTPKDGYEIE